VHVGRRQVLLAFMPAVHAGVGDLLRAGGLGVHHIIPVAASGIAAALGLMLSFSVSIPLLRLWSERILVRLL